MRVRIARQLIFCANKKERWEQANEDQLQSQMKND